MVGVDVVESELPVIAMSAAPVATVVLTTPTAIPAAVIVAYFGSMEENSASISSSGSDVGGSGIVGVGSGVSRWFMLVTR